MALGALRALHEAGYEIPRQVSIVGFDDIPEAQYYTPPLTTVRQDFGEIGRRSLQLMLEMMDSGDEGSPSPPMVGPELIVRSSTAAA
jgi:DNA-binding LacI/PurR family transcriptional regulator